jgi:hypothetical protein
MIRAKTVPGTELVYAIIEHFDDLCIDYKHIHNASPGCFNCAVTRAWFEVKSDQATCTLLADASAAPNVLAA